MVVIKKIAFYLKYFQYVIINYIKLKNISNECKRYSLDSFI